MVQKTQDRNDDLLVEDSVCTILWPTEHYLTTTASLVFPLYFYTNYSLPIVW